MTTIKHAGVPVAVVPASSTRDMEEEIAYYRDDGVTEASDIFDKVLAAAPSEPGADLVELIGALEGLNAALDAYWNDTARDAYPNLEKHQKAITGQQKRSGAALAKWETPDAG